MYQHTQRRKKEVDTAFTSGFTGWGWGGKANNIQRSKMQQMGKTKITVCRKKKKKERRNHKEVIMRALTSTASISYITKHASFDKELKSPGKLNGGETRCLVCSTPFFLQRFRVFFTSVYAFISHSFVNALCVDIFTQ